MSIKTVIPRFYESVGFKRVNTQIAYVKEVSSIIDN